MWGLLLRNNTCSFVFQNNIKNGIYPAPLQSLWAIVAILAALHFAKNGVVHPSVNAVLMLLPAYVCAHWARTVSL